MEIYPSGIHPHPTPPHARAVADGAEEVGGMGWGWGRRGNPCRYIAILDIEYWISMYLSIL